MSIPSSQVVSLWVKGELTSTDWLPLRDACFSALSIRWTGKSEEEIWEFIERFLQAIAEHLRDEASQCVVDGSAPKFEIDNEQLPYIRAIGWSSSSTLNKLRKIDPLEVESVCAKILDKFGASSQVTKSTGDGCVDFIAYGLNIVPNAFLVPQGARAVVIGQTKRYKDGHVISETKMREFVGAGVLRRHMMQTDGRLFALTPVIFAFWTTSDFEPNAKKYARDTGIWFMDGHTLATYVDNLYLTDYVMALPDSEIY